MESSVGQSWAIEPFSASRRPASFFSAFRIAVSTYAERSPSGTFSRNRAAVSGRSLTWKWTWPVDGRPVPLRFPPRLFFVSIVMNQIFLRT